MATRLNVDAADGVAVHAMDLRADIGGASEADSVGDELGEVELEQVGVVPAVLVQRGVIRPAEPGRREG
jgi:hypothetical protein